MATTYTVTNSFSADTTAVASEVNTNFSDVLAALNALDAANLTTGALPLGRISGLTTTQFAAATLVIESEGISSNDNDTTIPTSAAVKDFVDNANKTAQIVNTQTGEVATGTTVIPYDDTIPQNTEGDEFMTLAITPKSATNKLKIDIVFFFAHSSTVPVAVALFQGNTANALACGSWRIPTGNLLQNSITFTHYMTADTTSETTFKVRAGGSVGATLTFNGALSVRKYGGVMASSITITEYVP